MAFFENTRLELIERLIKHVVDKLPRNDTPLIKQFIRQYYLNVSPEDISTRSILDLYGAAISHWHYIFERQPRECKVRVYNPTMEEHGWQSAHTVIEIVTDDMPFLDDSVSMVLHQLDLNIHLIHSGTIKLRRDANGHVTEVCEANNNKTNDWRTEAAIYVEIDRQTGADFLGKLAENICRFLNEVRIVVESWSIMRDKANEVLYELETGRPPIEQEELSESIAFLQWLVDDHFTFMGYQKYDLVGKGGDQVFQSIEDSKLGLVKLNETYDTLKLSELPLEAQQLILSKQQLVLVGKTEQKSTVHRPVYFDFIGIKIFDQDGQVIGGHRFIGLFTAVAYTGRPKQIPFLRRKVSTILEQTGFAPRSHDERVLMNILETLPRDDLFQASVDELLKTAEGIFHLQERQKVRLFLRKDIFGSFFSCLVFVPREAYNSQLRERMQEILMRSLSGIEIEFSTRFTESTLARAHFIIHVNRIAPVPYDVKVMEAKLAESARTWQDDLRDALLEHCGEERGNELYKRYQKAFPAGYQESFLPQIAVVDIDYFENLCEEKSLLMSLYHPLEEAEDIIRFKLYRIGATIPLSDVVPILENMGLRIISERPYEITPKDQSSIWINDYRMVHPSGQAFGIEAVKDIFQESFAKVWWGKAENDGFNRLVLNGKLNWREIAVIRAYAKYLWQTGFSFSQDHVEDALSGNAMIAAELITLFKVRFETTSSKGEGAGADEKERTDRIDAQKEKIEQLLEMVSNLNEDRVLRRYLEVILATIRTNYYQLDSDQKLKPYISFKLDSAKVPELPLPVPLYEIFVYSPRVEAIHLRGAKVARGGIRWSDRREDFRTEVLGLMKAQQVKNAVIVPMGAKGGFVVKQLPDGTREQIMDEVIYCYKTLIRGLLDLTDNYKGQDVIHPYDVVRYDDEDPYLVVAADKGTATFSDIANSISKEYDFWLYDAFASGGSSGYDHKKMGITARGAWESVKGHFHELGVDIQKTDFTAMGIGDMAGDVFGNGMLLSRHLKLIAAFNHMHIFLDPNPDPEKSFEERQRLFNLPRSSWSDYNADLISKGGGIFLRSAKFIILSPEMQKVLDFNQEKVIPNELIRAILKAPVDLLWNGGIGTYVKSRHETNLMVGDRTNDAVRVNGIELKCKVVGEGGNLGFTQLGRIEYARAGGRLNTDAIDNSGGVNCSDNEVNIKILLNEAIENGELTEKQRNILLAEMQDEVAELVLNNNRRQTEAISIAVSQAADNIEMHSRLIQEMVKSGNIDRVLEFLPDKEELAIRKAANQGLTRPEIAVLMAYCKTLLKKAFLASELSEDPYFNRELERAFPTPLRVRFKQYMQTHRLKREIIATQVSNAVINEMGITFIGRLQDETGGLPPDIIRAYTVAREVFEAEAIHEKVNALNGKVESSIQLKMLQELNRLIRRGTRWFLRNRRSGMHIEDTIERFSPLVKEISNLLPSLLESPEGEMMVMAKSLIEANVPEHLAYRIGGMSAMFSSLDIVEAASKYNFDLDQVAAIYYEVGSRLQLGWFRELIKKHPITNHWEALARAAFRDDLDRQQRNLTVAIMRHNNSNQERTSEALIDSWFKKHQLQIQRWEFFVSELKGTSDINFTMFAVALRELFDMAELTKHVQRKDKTTQHPPMPAASTPF